MANYPPNVAGVASISSGAGVIVNNADPENPIVGLTVPVAATDGGTGLTASGTDATKFLKSDGADGWELGTPPQGTVTAVTAASPLASSGGTTPQISLTGTVAANRGGTGLSTSGTDATKYLKSNGSGGWELSTPAGTGTVTSVAVDSATGLTTDVDGGDPITTLGTISITTVPIGNSAVELVDYGSATEVEGIVSIKPSDGSSQALVLTAEVTNCSFDPTELAALAAANKSVTVAVFVTNGDGVSPIDITPIADKWLGTAPTVPVSVGVSDAYLLVLTNFDSTVVGSWQALVT